MLNVLCTTEELADIIRQVLREEKPSIQAAANIEEIIDTKQLCKKLNITEPTIIRWRKKGKIPFLLIGDSIRYDWHAVLKAITK